jgi:hypothetical protein
LIDGIYMVKEGVRTQLNQLLQDGWTWIEGRKYIWPKNLRFFFPVPIEKLDQLSEPYKSRHHQLRFESTKKTHPKISRRIQAKEIKKLLDDSEKLLDYSKPKLRILNFYGFEAEKAEALKDYRKTHSNVTKLVVSEDMEEMEWMYEVEVDRNKFKCSLRGLYEQLQKGNQIVEIVGIERNPAFLSVIESLVLANSAKKTEVHAMIPGLERVHMNPITIIFNTEKRIEYLLVEVAEWDQIESYEVEKNKEEPKPIVKNLIKKDEPKSELPYNYVSETNMKENLEKLEKEIEKC